MKAVATATEARIPRLRLRLRTVSSRFRWRGLRFARRSAFRCCSSPSVRAHSVFLIAVVALLRIVQPFFCGCTTLRRSKGKSWPLTSATVHWPFIQPQVLPLELPTFVRSNRGSGWVAPAGPHHTPMHPTPTAAAQGSAQVPFRFRRMSRRRRRQRGAGGSGCLDQCGGREQQQAGHQRPFRKQNCVRSSYSW